MLFAFCGSMNPDQSLKTDVPLLFLFSSLSSLSLFGLYFPLHFSSLFFLFSVFLSFILPLLPLSACATIFLGADRVTPPATTQHRTAVVRPSYP